MAETQTKEDPKAEEKSSEDKPQARSKKLYAFTDIIVGDDKGERKTIKHGEEVKGLSKEQTEELVASGSARDYPPIKGDQAPEALAEKDARIAELEAALEEARADKTKPGPTN